MKQPDGFNGYEGGASYWILPSGQKTYDYEELFESSHSYEVLIEVLSLNFE